MVTPQDLDGSEQNLDSDLVCDAGLDIASPMDMMMSMIIGLTNKVNGQEEASHPQSATVHLSLSAPRGVVGNCHEIVVAKPGLDPDIMEADIGTMRDS